MSQSLLKALQNPRLYPHPVESFQVVETHISWVLLTGPYAYKIKKPLDFGFLNFTSLALRKHFCEEELRLNRRTTDQLYLEVLPITGTSEAPILGGPGEPFEYCLKMRQFPQNNLLSEVQARGELSVQHIDALARLIAGFHNKAPRVAKEHPLSQADAIVAPILQNFEHARPLLTDPEDLRQLQRLQEWTECTIERLGPVLATRGARGAVRECHGDLHLGNVALIDGVPTPFDCIEFNEPFRLIDIGMDIAFLIMDLEDRGLYAFARRLTSLWLEGSGDYEGLPLLPLYKSHRAMVRAKIALFRLAQEPDRSKHQVILQEYRHYADLADSYAAIPYHFLAITHGVSAVGKSSVALGLVEALGGIRVRSDVERKRLFANADEGALYAPAVTTATYRRLHQLADQALEAGVSVVLDATYLKKEQRQQAEEVAERHAAPFLIIDCQAPDTVIARWLKQRQQDAKDPSDATLQVVRAQQEGQEALDEEERLHTWPIDTPAPHSLEALIAGIRKGMPGL